MRSAKQILSEAGLVAALGLAFAVGANALSPRGLRLGRNYFPATAAASTSLPAPARPVLAEENKIANVSSSTNSDTLRGDARPHLTEHGLRAAGSNDVIRLFRDERYAQGLVVFVDARSDANYQTGHIPGAWQFDHYRAEAYFDTVLPVCQNAQLVVVYCSGGDCEDSEFAAIMLRDAGIPAEKLYVYVGGITEWMAHKLPVETGARESGQLPNPKP